MAVFAPCCLPGVCGLFYFFFSFCAKRFMLIVWERFPGPLGCQACWRHIWPELFLSFQVKNGRISTQTASFVQSPSTSASLEALQTHAICCGSFPGCRGHCCFVLSFARYCLCHVAFSLEYAGVKGVSPIPSWHGRDIQASALPPFSPSSSSPMASPTSWWPATRTRAWRTRCWSVSTAGRRSSSWTGRRS